ncbi:MAG: hypothetical protein Kow0029_29220 [Candidatus Rifleibacteriota bacterium]
MAKKSDKRTSNLIIAGGYCLVALIILLNYLGEASRNRTFNADATKRYVSEAEQAKSLDYLRKQLEEEKKVNSEMRAMLREMQKSSSSLLTGENKVFAKVSMDDLLKIPELNLDLIEKATRPRPNPFIPGKNPYAPQSKSEEPGKSVMTSYPFVKSLKCDPNLPFLISGANSASVFIGD